MSRATFRPRGLILMLLSSLLLSPLIGCSPDPDPEPTPTPDASTPGTPGPDASTPDASTPDASTPDASTPDASTPDASTPDASTPDEVHGLMGEYYRMSSPSAWDFAELGAVTLDPNIDFSDLTGIYQDLTGRNTSTTVRWTGRITAPETGDYTFYAIGDNGFRLYVGGQKRIDFWVNQWDKEQTSAKVHFVKGESQEFKLELFQDSGGANMFLRWSSDTLTKRIVPSSAFTPPPGFEVYPVDLTVSQNGLQLTMDFREPVSALGDLLAHTVVAADITAFPLVSATITNDPSVVLVTLGEPIQRNQRVRVTYDGTGNLSVGGKLVPKIYRDATNLSTHRLRTPWAEQVDPANPLPEYPRPQHVRGKWASLNGRWQFSKASASEQPVFGKVLPETIVVPYPVESQLSGIERHEDHMFYRRLFTVPADWQVGSGQKLMLNFGAVDYRARVWVNGQQVRDHSGGYNAFSIDITPALKSSGEQELIVAVTDTTGRNQPLGKQTPNPGGIFYTPTSGIWQSVWMEPVPTVAIDRLVTTPDVPSSTVTFDARSASASSAASVTVRVFTADDQLVGTVTGAANTTLSLSLASPRLWSPEDPYLYKLKVSLTDGASTDSIDSYFGMRTVALQNVGGFPKLTLNGKPVFFLSMLDQGFWPDGIYTAPTDAALRWDVQIQKDFGFNGVRKHIKVEPDRWYYHADQIGLMVLQDFVSAFPDEDPSDLGKEAFTSQGLAMMAQLHNSPAVVGWVVFNEGWSEWGKVQTGLLADQVKSTDPTRWVTARSGVNCCRRANEDSGKGDIIDNHDYNNDSPPYPDATRAAMDGEHGGFVLRSPGHQWPGAPTVIYSGVEDKAALTAKYVSNTRTFYLAAAGAELSGSVYTQVTDVENELNGLYTYDRRVMKVDMAAVKDINQQVIAAGVTAGDDATFPGQGSWTLDEGTGSVAHDATAAKSDMGLHGNANWVNGVRGKALHFDGNGDFAETSLPVVDTRGSYTISAWVTLDTLPGNYATAVSQDGRKRENPFYLQYGHGTFAFSTPGGNRATYNVTPALNRWYHLVGVRDGAQQRLYLDGVRVASNTAGAADVSTGALAIGRAKYAGNDVDFWAGSVDEVQVFGRALSDSEVTSLYNSVPH